MTQTKLTTRNDDKAGLYIASFDSSTMMLSKIKIIRGYIENYYGRNEATSQAHNKNYGVIYKNSIHRYYIYGVNLTRSEGERKREFSQRNFIFSYNPKTQESNERIFKGDYSITSLPSMDYFANDFLFTFAGFKNRDDGRGSYKNRQILNQNLEDIKIFKEQKINYFDIYSSSSIQVNNYIYNIFGKGNDLLIDTIDVESGKQLGIIKLFSIDQADHLTFSDSLYSKRHNLIFHAVSTASLRRTNGETVMLFVIDPAINEE